MPSGQPATTKNYAPVKNQGEDSYADDMSFLQKLT